MAAFNGLEKASKVVAMNGHASNGHASNGHAKKGQ